MTTAPVRIDARAWGDLRFATLARLCGLADLDHGLIKCSKIWSWQTEHYTPEAPTYVVDVDLVETVLGPGGADHLVRARLAEATPDGLRMRGSHGRIEWLWKLRNAAPRGGEATKRKHENKSGPHGRPGDRAEAQPEPGPLSLPLSPDPQSSGSHTYARERHPDCVPIGLKAWKRGLDVSLELRDRNVKVPAWPLQHSPSHTGWIELLNRIDEQLVDSTATQAEAVVINRIEVARAKALAEGKGSWFTPNGMFAKKSFDTFAAQDPKDFEAKRERAGPRRSGDLIGSASPRNDHPEGERLIPINEIPVPR